MTTRPSHRPPLRRRPFVLRTEEVTPTRRRGRQTILTPSKGYRIRLVRLKVVQPASDDRHLCEVYFGTGGSLITDPSRAIDILAVPDGGSVSTRAYPREQGPRGRPRRAPEPPLAGAPPVHRPQGHHRVRRGELTSMVDAHLSFCHPFSRELPMALRATHVYENQLRREFSKDFTPTPSTGSGQA